MSNIKKISIVLIVILILGVLAWAFPYAQGWYRARQAMQYYNEQIALHQADKYGGDTPEQTWEMFLTALRAQDFDLASKYIILKKQGEYKEWFVQVKQEGLLKEMIQDLTMITVDYIRESTAEYHYEALDTDGRRVTPSISFDKNINNKWKIRSF